METDASNQAIAGILSQFHVENEVNILHPVEYHSRTLSTSQRNWPIHDKELFAIVDCFKKWRNWLIGVPIDIYTDHQGLKYFNTKRRLNARQAEWSLVLAEFRYTIHYRPGSKMGKLDAITRRSGDEKAGLEHRLFDVGQLSCIKLRANFDADERMHDASEMSVHEGKTMECMPMVPNFRDKTSLPLAPVLMNVLYSEYVPMNVPNSKNVPMNVPNMKDVPMNAQMNALISEDEHTPDINEANTTNLDDIEIEALRLDVSTWQKNSDGLWIVPEQHRLQVLRQCHDSIVAGHWGRDKTYEMLT